MYTISELLWLKPTRHQLYQRNLKYLPFLIVSLTKQVSARFLDTPAQQCTVRPTSRARFLNVNCDQLTDMHTRLRPTPQAGRSPATFDFVSGGHCRAGVSRRWPLPPLNVGQFVAVLVSKSTHAHCWPDSALFCGSASKQCTNLYLVLKKLNWINTNVTL